MSDLLRAVTEDFAARLAEVWDINVSYSNLKIPGSSPCSFIEWNEPTDSEIQRALRKFRGSSGSDLKVKSLLFRIGFDSSEARLYTLDLLVGVYPYADPDFPSNLLRRVMSHLAVVDVIMHELALIPGVGWKVQGIYVDEHNDEQPAYRVSYAKSDADAPEDVAVLSYSSRSGSVV